MPQRRTIIIIRFVEAEAECDLVGYILYTEHAIALIDGRDLE